MLPNKIPTHKLETMTKKFIIQQYHLLYRQAMVLREANANLQAVIDEHEGR